MSEFWIDFITAILLLAIGGFVLFAGRRQLWATMGVIGLTVTGRLLTLLVTDYDRAYELIYHQEWQLVGIAVLVGLLGIVVSRLLPVIAALLIGFAAGADLALWFYDIAAYFITDVANLPENTGVWVGLAVVVIGGLLGLWLVRTSRDEALILITVLIGVQIIQDALGFSRDNSWTAIFVLTIALAGMLVQYALYLRELKACSELTEPEPLPSSVAYFQNLQLDE